SVVLRLFTNIYGYFVVYVLTASWLGSLGVVYLPFRLSLDTALGILILSAFSLAPIAGKYRIMQDRKSTPLNSSHEWISYGLVCCAASPVLPSFPTRRSSDLSVVLRLFTNIYGYFVVYVLTASWLGSLGVVYLPFRLSLDTALGILILSAFSLAPIAGKYRIM